MLNAVTPVGVSGPTARPEKGRHLEDITRGWQAERQAERLARQVWCALGEEERRAHAAARQFGKGGVKFRRRSASLWALAWTPLRLGGLGTNPEYAVKSVDRFLTCLSRIRVEIHDGRTVRLKLWVRRSPLRPLPFWAEVAWAAAGG